MKAKKIISSLMTVTMLLMSMPANAALTTKEEAMQGYGNYPQSVKIDSTSNAQSFTASNYQSFKFSVKSKDTGTLLNRYTVLDRDADGNYLVIAACDFNQLPSAGQYSLATDVNSATQKAEECHYDPTKAGTIAYFLTSDAQWQLKHNGTSIGKLPSEIKSNILKNKTWTIEPEALDLPTAAQIAKFTEEEKAAYDSWLANRDAQQRTITADIVLPSYTELKYYADKIGVESFEKDAVALSRSLYSSCTVENNKPVYRNRVFGLRFTSNTTTVLERGRHVGGYKDKYYRYLPMFWLSKDFFKNVPVVLDNTGEEVVKQIKQYNASEVTSIYTTEEINRLYSMSDLIGDYSYDELAAMGYDLESAGYPASTFAGYWNYPAHKAITDRSQITGGALSGGAPAENVFHVADADGNDRSFVLLDRDANGNYLVIVDEDYGRHAYTTLCNEGNSAQTTKNESDWKFDTENEKSIGYWLNNDFLVNGNGNKKLPKGVIDNLVEKDWDVEDNISTNGTISSTATGYDEYIALKNSKTGVKTVRGKVALPSRTEFGTYKSKMSADTATQHSNWKNWGGYYTRTGVTEAKETNGAVTYTNYFYHICGSNTNMTNATLARDGQLTKNDVDAYPVRPIFWLESDFFKEVAVNTATVGANVKKQIVQYDKNELSDTYSYAQLQELGYAIDDSWLGYGNYPVHNKLTTAGNVTSQTPSGASPEENVFYVKDNSGNKRSFILLDRDKDGNYLVMTEEEYGVHKYSDLSGSELKSPETADAQWQFDPANESSIAYWLNSNEAGGFLQNGNGGKILPAGVVNKILEKEWVIENTVVTGAEAIEEAWNVGDITVDDYDLFETWMDNKGDLRTVTAKIALPSRTEYVTYKDKIGATSYREFSNWAGSMSRTANSRVSLDSNYNVVYENRFYHICGSNGNNQQYVNMTASGNMSDDYAIGAYYVRPIFWLSADFFKTVPVEVTSGSENVIRQIKQYDIETLQAAGYTSEQLAIIFDLKTAEIGEISIINEQGNAMENLNGETVVGAKVTVKGGSFDATKSFIIVVYDNNNKIVDMLVEDLEISANSEEHEVTKYLTLDKACGAFYKCKAMIWEDMESMQPIRYKEFK